MSILPTASATPASARRRVFVVDDHAFVREWLISFIEQHHDLCVCGQAGEANDAFAQIERLNPEIAVVDLSLHGESGLELIKRMQTLTPRPQVLVLSMLDEVYYAERALRAGALGYVMKRETTSKVIEGIRHVLQGQFYMSEPLAALIAQKFVGRGVTPGAPAVEKLGDREVEVFRLIGQGYENRRIAEE
ncbi:MAG: response regulator transcription factor, partial [Opitutales bacterium]